MKSIKNGLNFITVLAVLMVVSGCAGPGAIKQSFDADRQRVKQVSTSMGQRTFDVSHDILIKAFINAFSSRNLTVLTLEKDAGYIMAEGSQFLNDSEIMRIRNQRDSRLNSELGNSISDSFPLPNVDLRITVNLYEKDGNKTIVKMLINPKVKNCMLYIGGRFLELEGDCPPPPEMVSLWYQQLWNDIEKSIFMQRETILN